MFRRATRQKSGKVSSSQPTWLDIYVSVYSELAGYSPAKATALRLLIVEHLVQDGSAEGLAYAALRPSQRDARAFICQARQDPKAFFAKMGGDPREESE
jgi:hypothetical protein